MGESGEPRRPTAKAAQALKDGIAANPAAAGRLKAQAQLLGVPGA